MVIQWSVQISGGSSQKKMALEGSEMILSVFQVKDLEGNDGGVISSQLGVVFCTSELLNQTLIDDVRMLSNI